jgi:hypothetical protein
METCFFGFGHSALLENGNRIRFRYVETLNADQVRELIDDGVEPCLDRRYGHLVRALRRRHGIHVPMPGIARARPRRSDYVVTASLEAPTRPFLVDPCEYRDDEIEQAEFYFTLEEAC